MSCHVMSFHFISFHDISCHFMSFHVISCHFMPYHVIYHVSLDLSDQLSIKSGRGQISLSRQQLCCQAEGKNKYGLAGDIVCSTAEYHYFRPRKREREREREREKKKKKKKKKKKIVLSSQYTLSSLAIHYACKQIVF
jgi:hypothetical protein